MKQVRQHSLSKPRSFMFLLVFLTILLSVIQFGSTAQAMIISKVNCSVISRTCDWIFLNGTKRVITATQPVEVGFQYRQKGSSSWIKVEDESDDLSDNVWKKSISDLNPGVTYEFRAYYFLYESDFEPVTSSTLTITMYQRPEFHVSLKSVKMNSIALKIDLNTEYPINMIYYLYKNGEDITDLSNNYLIKEYTGIGTEICEVSGLASNMSYEITIKATGYGSGSYTPIAEFSFKTLKADATPTPVPSKPPEETTSATIVETTTETMVETTTETMVETTTETIAETSSALTSIETTATSETTAANQSDTLPNETTASETSSTSGNGTLVAIIVVLAVVASAAIAGILYMFFRSKKKA